MNNAMTSNQKANNATTTDTKLSEKKKTLKEEPFSVKASPKTVVLCGSMANLLRFYETIEKHPKIKFYPTEEHFKKITEMVRNQDAPIPNRGRLKLVLEHFGWIREAGEVWILNEIADTKFLTREYVGVGTAIDIGYALALNKTIKWVRRPTDPNLIAIFEAKDEKGQERLGRETNV